MVNQIGKWAFIVGAIIALIAGIGAGADMPWADEAWLTAIMIICGLTVGVVNITAKEVHGFLLASVAVLIAGTADMGSIFPELFFGSVIIGIISKLAIVIVPAALIVALRSIYGFAAE